MECQLEFFVHTRIHGGRGVLFEKFFTGYWVGLVKVIGLAVEEKLTAWL
jgi:hypothetical protein